MKRILAMLSAVMLLCTLTACAEAENQSGSHSSQTVQGENASEDEIFSMPDESKSTVHEKSRVLVAYFSATGNTECVAQYVQTVLDADLYEIVPRSLIRITISITATVTAVLTWNKMIPMPGPLLPEHWSIRKIMMWCFWVTRSGGDRRPRSCRPFWKAMILTA